LRGHKLMRKRPRLSFAFLLGMFLASGQLPALMASSAEVSGTAAKNTSKTALKTVAATPDIPFQNYDSSAEQLLVQLANKARREAGISGLTFDEGLSRAARVHAQAMFEARQLSHRFEGEASLPERLAAATQLQLDREGENVALDFDPAQAHNHLMLSPPHRANLLNPAYNVVGMAVLRTGDRLYVVQDFGHAVPSYTAAQAKDRIAAAIKLMRQQANQPQLKRRDLTNADETACSMAHADKLGTAPVNQLAERFSVLSFTSLYPETLPAEAKEAVTGPNLHAFSVGACYARSATYVTGVYWVVLALD
jgi:uncharacterized protein YkwD